MGRYYSLAVLYAFTLYSVIHHSNGVTVDIIGQGKVEGLDTQSSDSVKLSTFRGIPYAEPPVGDLRWQKPQPHPGWEDTFDATRFKNACWQKDGEALFWTFIESQSEDCLYLNVYAPDVEENKGELFPVMVWFHGGGFNIDWSGNPLYHGEEIARMKVVVVSGNYRLGPLGFLSDEDQYLGNYGLYDQREILLWVQKHIPHFNGDPNQVTIFGQSAGGTSVSHHVLSPLTDGLFTKAVIQSGTSAAVWAVNPEPKRYTRLLAEDVGCPTNSNEDMMFCLKGKPVEELMTADVPNDDITIIWTPTLDGPGGFIPEEPLEVLKSGTYKQDQELKVLIGVTKDEGFILVGTLIGIPMADVDTETFRNEVVPTAVRKVGVKDTTNSVANAIIMEYTNWLIPDDPRQAKMSASEVVGDGGLKAAADLEATYHAKNNRTVYYYALEMFFDRIGNFIPDIVIHCLDLFYLFGYPHRDVVYCVPVTLPGSNESCTEINAGLLFNYQDKQFSRKMIDLWTNFAINGNPTPEPVDDVTWEKFSPEEKEYMILDSTLAMDTKYEQRQVQFWNEYVWSLHDVTNEQLPQESKQEEADHKAEKKNIHIVNMIDEELAGNGDDYTVQDNVIARFKRSVASVDQFSTISKLYGLVGIASITSVISVVLGIQLSSKYRQLHPSR